MTDQNPSRLPAAVSSQWAWVPVRSLSPRHRPRIAAHLLGLNEQDRYLRFGHPASDEQIARYVATLDFDRDEVFGIFNRRLELIAMAHLAYSPSDTHGHTPAIAELGVSVRAGARGRGYGAKLFEHAAMHARNRGVENMLIHALSENTAMLKIAREAGAIVERNGSEADAWVTLPRETFATRFEELFETQAAEIDYQLKVQARRVTDMLETLAQVKTHPSSKAPTAPK
jgi:GNAT superfamily N-acetyltransferase